MASTVVVAGVGMIPFAKPGASPPYDEMGTAAARLALQDAGIGYQAVLQAYAGYVYGDSTAGQKAIYPLGLTGLPIVNVNNNCSTGSTALFLGRQAVESGAADCVLVLGFEQMQPGALGTIFQDRPSPFVDFDAVTDKLVDAKQIPLALRYFGGAGLSHMQKYGTKLETFAKVRAKASRHARNNPLAIFRAQAMVTDFASTFDSNDMMRVVGFDMARAAATLVYERACLGPDDIDVIELHDCFAQNELITYEALGLCGEGGAEAFVENGDNTYGGKVVTNPSGGLLSKGHPLGATGLAQCYELTRQLRGDAGATQVDGARRALQHNLGLGGACVVTLYEQA